MPYENYVIHFFNHQTHHGGPLLKVLTEVRSQAPVSVIVFMPEEV